jgi:transcriptional regulator with XRE-family HTH domain
MHSAAMIDETIGARVKRLRNAVTPPITQDAIAKVCGITRQAVNQWERDLTAPSGNSLLSAARMLKVSPGYLLHGEGSPHIPSGFDEAVLQQAITDALNYMASIETKVEDDPAKFAEVVSMQYHIREGQTSGD